MVKVLQHLSVTEWSIGCSVGILIILMLGMVANAVLKDFGFGILANGLLVVIGVGGGVFARSITLGFQ